MIRVANICDLDGIMQVISDAKALFRQEGSDQWQDLDNYPNEITITNDINNKEMYVKVINNQIVGCIVLSKIRELCYDNMKIGKWINTDNYMVIHRLAVRKEMYKRGIAQELINEMVEIAKENAVFSIKVDTKKENIRMISLLTKLNFVEVGKIYLLRSDCLDKERIAFELNLK